MNAVAIPCDHCGLPVTASDLHDAKTRGESQAFCCAGCRAVWRALHDAGLSAYYDVSAADASRRAASPAHISGRGFEHLDHIGFRDQHAQRTGTDWSCRFRVDGLHCGACVWLLESLPGVVQGLRAARVHLADSSIELEWAHDASLASIARSIDRLGYQLSPIDAPVEWAHQRLRRREVLELGVAGALAVNAMGLAFALYGAHFDGMDPSLRSFVQWWSVALATASVVWPGRHFFVNASTALRTRVPHMDIPVAFGLTSALIAAWCATARGSGAIYAEGVSMLVFLLLVGRFLQRAAQRRALSRIESVMALMPATARRVIDASGAVEEVLVEHLRPGDLIDVPAHESVGADGRLVTSSASVDRSHLTGESTPVQCRAGDWVDAGSRALAAPICVRVECVGSATRAAQIAALVREAAATKAPICQLADRMAGWFLATVLVLAASCVVWWAPRLGWDTAVERTVALLVVTCPCALGFATPLAVLAGIGGAARRGVLIKNGETLERLGSVGTLILDKTGTITVGRPSIVSMHGDASALRLAAAVERHSTHPCATTIVDSIAAGNAAPIAIHESVTEVVGEGIAGTVEGHQVVVGNERILARYGVQPVQPPSRPVNAAVVFVAVDGAVALTMCIGDRIRDGSATTVNALKRRGWRVMLASGDDPAVAKAVGREVGLCDEDIFGGLTPEAKLDLVRTPALSTPVVMVGDGINDVAALAAADCGVWVRGGTQGAARTADACLAGDGLPPLRSLLDGAHRTMQVIRINLTISLLYNAIGATAAFMGWVNPIVASVLMPLSGLTVLATSLSLTRIPTHAPTRGAYSGGA